MLIVADFRFGNAIVGSSPLPSSLFVDGYRNVSREYLDSSTDELLLAKCSAALSQWRETFGEKLLVIHWTGLARRNEDMLRGKYVSNGVYRHPTWNFDGLESEDISALAKAPLEVIRALYVDDNLHPSALGFRYLELRGKLTPPAEALRDSIRWIEERVRSFLRSPHREAVLVTGDSVWVKSAVRLLYGRPLATLSQSGVYIKPLTFDEITKFTRDHAVNKVVFVTDQGPHREQFMASCFDAIERRISSGGQRVQVTLFPWAAIAREVVSRRHRDLLHLATPDFPTLIKWLRTMQVDQFLDQAVDFDKNVDLGEELIPTLEGIRLILSRCC
ncbi:hypothetical protein [Ensifer sesbaniae]|uniref:hypothetical protein n=1 Tax=Ensifer sesbaniae TaxID=1214071 RepID=UPI0020009C34